VDHFHCLLLGISIKEYYQAFDQLLFIHGPKERGKMEVHMILQGFPGKMTRGYMGWSSVVLVDTGEQKILFDTGGYGERAEIPKRFKQLEIEMTDVDILVLSHFHHDHVINYDYFTNARIMIHEKEVEWVQSDIFDWAAPKHLFPIVESTGRLEVIKGDVEIAPKVHTLLSPGHTPGCMALILKDSNRPTTILAGDAVKNMHELVTGRVDMSWDNEASAKSIRRIREVGEIIIPGHDRILQLSQNKVKALTSCHETIFIPKGVAHPLDSKTIDLMIEPTEFNMKEE
jgi:glyoxylase-like metal-dependent hydrolase (beta-lactamase superfamily II)